MNQSICEAQIILRHFPVWAILAVLVCFVLQVDFFTYKVRNNVYLNIIYNNKNLKITYNLHEIQGSTKVRVSSVADRIRNFSLNSVPNLIIKKIARFTSLVVEHYNKLGLACLKQSVQVERVGWS